MRQEDLCYRLDVARQVSFTLSMTINAIAIQLSTKGTVDSSDWFLRLILTQVDQV